MDSLVAASFEILSFGAIITLIVLGLGIIASMMGIFNFAQGEFVLLGAYTTYLIHSWGWPVWSGMIAAPFVVGVIGLVLEVIVIRRFYAAPIVAMLGTYAMSLVIRESIRVETGGLYLTVPEPITGSMELGGVHLSIWRIVIIVITLLVIALCYLMLEYTDFGLRLRASLENPSLARVSGISTRLIYAITFAIGTALAGLAGALIVPIFSLSADLGIRFLIQGFVAVMIGGIGTFVGPIIGGGIVGILSAALPWVVPAILADVLVVAAAIVFVKIRPQGLVSRIGG